MNEGINKEEMFECKMYITDLETDKKSKEINVQDLVFDDYIEFEFGDYEDEDYLQLPYNDFKFFINDYSVTFYSPQYYKLQSNWNSLRELIKWRPIEEYDENKYDWVLIKYYDGDYECVPTVAERRKGTNKWYDTNNNEIIFEVKYFFDMQLLDKMNELEGKVEK